MEADGTLPTPQVYEDFKPTTKWVNEDDLDTLVIDVPGFDKHQMRVQVVSSEQQGSKILRITGQRRLHHNTWSRFRIEFPLSENCDLNKISAKLERDILFVKQPKLVSLAAKPEEESLKPMPTPQKPAKPEEESLKPMPTPQKPAKPEEESLKPMPTPQKPAKPEEESLKPMPTPQKPVDEPNVSPKTTDETPAQTSQPNTENKEAEKDQDVPEMSVQEKASENYKWAVGVIATKLKTSKNTVDIMVILLVGLMIGIYVSNTIKSFVKV